MILIVDDEEDVRQVTIALLGVDEPAVAEAADGFEAWEKAASQKFDLIICDYHMPHCDGLKFASTVRQKENPNRDTPIILISGYIGSLPEEESLENIYFISKPVSEGQLHRMIRIVTGGAINPMRKGA
ncbi:response regulator [Pseudobacteriovorax antillogorgiicola]|uniref:Response regulator receiver domain-containing protein n=1 Tax=Pseudobacteriovorax antillogorgiicola TaxID=1513793 RepID=A0A1Y6BCS8_9BACT|nr:response regulator [Pseudobacteriovorax antillogorgiicola]TCS56495.1 response regulator receiver domain-containing protein [Pseudobacteriovorax antillogorgiicola]SMF04801.1 Response regulator receiver domain-containing protein [Pseudobacteriovorax antillogorgiicola]